MTANEPNAERKEWIAVIHGQNGTWKIAAMNAESMVRQLEAQTKGGNMIASVYQRQAEIYTNQEVGR